MLRQLPCSSHRRRQRAPRAVPAASAIASVRQDLSSGSRPRREARPWPTRPTIARRLFRTGSAPGAVRCAPGPGVASAADGARSRAGSVRARTGPDRRAARRPARTPSGTAPRPPAILGPIGPVFGTDAASWSSCKLGRASVLASGFPAVSTTRRERLHFAGIGLDAVPASKPLQMKVPVANDFCGC